MNKKKLIALALSLGLVAGAAGTMNLVTANAAIKEQNVADTILTTTGDIHMDWEAKGDTASTSFVSNVKGDVLAASNVVWGTGWLTPWDTTTFANGNVTLSIDVLEWVSGAWCPYIAEGTVDSIKDKVWYNAQLHDLGAHVGNTTTPVEFYTDETLTEAYAAGVWYYAFNWPTCADGQAYHIEYVFTVDGTLGVKSYPILADGTYGAVNQVWMKNAFSGLNETTNYYFGFWYWTDSSMMFDNLKVATPAGTVFETGFSGNWATIDGVPAAGKVHNVGGKTKTIAEVALTPANTDRLVTFEEVSMDENLNQVFKLSGSMDIRTLGKKFGIATGLDDQMGDIYADGTSYVYFSQVDGATYLTPVNNGVEGTPVSFGADLVTGDFYDFEFVGTKTGATFTLDGHTVEFELANVEGFVAFVTDGEGEASVALGGETKLIRYAYRGSQGGAIANNFNTGYVNPANWESNTLNAVMVADPTEARGIVFEDGKVKFDGTADSSYFGTSEFYSDYVVEFLYSDSFDGDKPALKEGWTAGYSCLSLNMGVVDAGSGWAKNSMMLFIDDGAFNMLNFKTAGGAADLRSINYNFSGAAAGEVKTTAIKIVVANNTVKAYYQEVVEGVEPTAEAYILGGEWVVPEIYGKVTFATTDSGFFALDDIRITPIDDPNPETVFANAEAYVSFAPIADEYRPFTLEAPELTMEGTTVMWEAVEEATGYVVNVNGTETTVGADVLSFVVDCSEAGDYVVTVKALGNGAHISDSYQSEPIEFTVQPTGGEEDSSVPTTSEEPAPAPAPSKGGLFDCNNVVAGTMVPTIAAFAVAMLLKKRKED